MKMVDSMYDSETAQLRETLLDEKLGANRLHVVTTWKWDREKREARFWMREDVLRGVRKVEEGWGLETWRTDSWYPLNMFSPFEREVAWEVGRRWVRVQKGKGDIGAIAVR